MTPKAIPQQFSRKFPIVAASLG